MMKKIILVLLAICMSIFICACAQSEENNTQGENREETPKYNTAFPNDKLVGDNVITVEMAEEDLRNYILGGYDSDEIINIEFVDLDIDQSDFLFITADFYFNVTVQTENGQRNYLANVNYYDGNDSKSTCWFTFSKKTSGLS